MQTKGPLRRSQADRWVAGVCGGLAAWAGMSSGAVRAIFIVLSIFPGSILGGLVVYVILWLAVPEEPPAEPATPAVPAQPPPAT